MENNRDTIRDRRKAEIFIALLAENVEMNRQAGYVKGDYLLKGWRGCENFSRIKYTKEHEGKLRMDWYISVYQICTKCPKTSICGAAKARKDLKAGDQASVDNLKCF